MPVNRKEEDRDRDETGSSLSPLDRIPTFISGFDDALGGGIPSESIVLLTGGPGTFKSSLAYSLLYRNAERIGRNGLYITAEQSFRELDAQFRSMGFDRSSLEGRIHTLDYTTRDPDHIRSDMDFVTDLISLVQRGKKEKDISLVVIDSINALMTVAGITEARNTVFHLFEGMRAMGITVIVIAERIPLMSPVSFSDYIDGPGITDESFMGDGVFTLRLATRMGKTRRLIRCRKLRSTEHRTDEFQLSFANGCFRAMQLISPG